jgi:hypothetical protein
MNALDRKVGEIIARYLHDQDPRIRWTVTTAPDRETRPSAVEALAASGRPATPQADETRHAA